MTATCIALVSALWMASPTAIQQVNARAATLRDFQTRLVAYVALRNSLARRMGPPVSTTDAVELGRRRRQLAAAVQTARRNAKQGDLFTPAVVVLITETVNADFQRRAASDKQAAFEEVPAGTRPGINRTYPASAALATVPPLLLNNLPRLPDSLQYRFFDRHIVLLDDDTELILDYVPNLLPPLAQNDPDHR